MYTPAPQELIYHSHHNGFLQHLLREILGNDMEKVLRMNPHQFHTFAGKPLCVENSLLNIG